MKTLLLAFSALVCSLAASGQNATYRYYFNGNLNESSAKAPALTTTCATGTFANETLPIGVSKKTYRFDKGCGLTYNDATKNFITAGTYTIELYFKLDTISGYKKLVDFDSLKVDAGLYNQSGKIVLYPNLTSADSFVGAGVYQYVAISRDGSTKKMYVSANGKSVGTYTDNTDQYKLSTAKLLTFFQDDKSTNGEQSNGTVAMIQISNYVIDSNTIKGNFSQLNHTLEVGALSTGPGSMQIYPNPAGSSLHLTAPVAANYSICDLSGRSLTTGVLQPGDNRILIESLPAGLYILKATSTDGSALRAYPFAKQD